MDRYKATQLEKELKGKALEGFIIEAFVNNGKSAAVFRASKDGKSYAFKIFDSDIIERFGHEIQIKRIEQEIGLKNHDIDGLVKIIDGGVTILDGLDYYYIVMEYIEGLNLKEFISTKTYNSEFIVNVVQTLAQTTEKLLTSHQIAHRDIKPENIMIDRDGNIILMDLGVLKLVGAKSFTDDEEKQFVGTLRYAPPEFLSRSEEDSADGWRAVNLYQIGAVAHDLIMRQELFTGKTPYSNLVIAIRDDNPRITHTDISFELLQLVRDLLIKDWKKRLQICTLSRIMDMKIVHSATDDLDAEIDEILKMSAGRQAKFEEIERLRRTTEEIRKKQKERSATIALVFKECLADLQSKNLFRKFDQAPVFSDGNGYNPLVENATFRLFGDLDLGFPAPFTIWVYITTDEHGYSEIGLVGSFLLSIGVIAGDFGSTVVNYISKIRSDQIQPKIFSGVLEVDPEFRRIVKAKLVRLIHNGIKSVEDYVSKRILDQESVARGIGSPSRIFDFPKSTVVDAN